MLLKLLLADVWFLTSALIIFAVATDYRANAIKNIVSVLFILGFLAVPIILIAQIFS